MPDCDLLVTGSRGFVGRHVLERARVAGLGVHVTSGDLRDLDVADAAVRTAPPRAVIHLAAAPRGAEPWAALGADVAMAGAILAAVTRHAPEAPVLMAGSAAQYGMGAARALVEDDATLPVSAYGALKCVVERAALAAPLSLGVRVICARSFNHIGPGQGADAPAGQWARQVVDAEAAGGGAIRTGDLDAVRDFLDVRDVADAYLALVRSGAHGVVNVCSGTPVPIGRVVDAFVRHSDAAMTVQRDPALVRGIDPPYVVGDPRRLHALTGWSPQIALERSVADLLAACRHERVIGAGVSAAAR